MLTVFSTIQIQLATSDGIADASEELFLSILLWKHYLNLNYLHHKTYLKTVPGQPVQGQFKLRSYLSLSHTNSRKRIFNPSLVYHQVQKWCGCMIGRKMPWILEWGWKMVSGHLRLTTTSGPATLESLLHIIWWLLQQLWVQKSSMLCWVWRQQLWGSSWPCKGRGWHSTGTRQWWHWQ